MEPRDAALFPAAAESFRAGLADRSYTGAVFFAVCRCGASFSHALRPFVLRIARALTHVSACAHALMRISSGANSRYFSVSVATLWLHP